MIKLPQGALRFLTACAVAWAGAATHVAAAGIAIAPVIVEIDSPRRVVAVTVTNGTDKALTLQAQSLAWQQADGKDRFEPTDGLLVVPPLADVRPGTSQVFRIMLRVPAPAAAERAYRLVLEDISAEQVPATESTISFKLTHNLPVMVAAAGKPVAAVRWKPCAASAAGEACVSLLNAGNRRVRVHTLTLSGDGWQQTLELKGGENVLAGAQREWRAPLPAGSVPSLRGVAVRTGRGETLQAERGDF